MAELAWGAIGAGAVLAGGPYAMIGRPVGAALICLGALSLANPALADQSIPAADNGTVACTASAKDLTRISLAGDQFASVSKISTGNPAEDFKIVNEPVRGDIYISVPDGFTKPNLSFFGTTRKGYVYKKISNKATYLRSPEVEAAVKDAMVPFLDGVELNRKVGKNLSTEACLKQLNSKTCCGCLCNAHDATFSFV